MKRSRDPMASPCLASLSLIVIVVALSEGKP